MTTYNELIKKNAYKFNDAEQLEDFINEYTQNGDSLEEVKDLDDNISEYADGLVPIYYYDIVKEWQENGDCHELTLEVVGEYDQKAGIYKMMMSDLYFWYEQQLREDYNKLIEIIEDAGIVDDSDERTDEEIMEDNREPDIKA
jgi:hypothetical protein